MSSETDAKEILNSILYANIANLFKYACRFIFSLLYLQLITTGASLVSSPILIKLDSELACKKKIHNMFLDTV